MPMTIAIILHSLSLLGCPPTAETRLSVYLGASRWCAARGRA